MPEWCRRITAAPPGTSVEVTTAVTRGEWMMICCFRGRWEVPEKSFLYGFKKDLRGYTADWMVSRVE